MKEKHDDFYKALRDRIRGWLAKRGKQYRYADFLMFAPDLFHLISRLVLDKRCSQITTHRQTMLTLPT